MEVRGELQMSGARANRGGRQSMLVYWKKGRRTVNGESPGQGRR